MDQNSVKAGESLEIISLLGGRTSEFSEVRGLESSSLFNFPLVYTDTSISVLPSLISPIVTTGSVTPSTSSGSTTGSPTTDGPTTGGSTTGGELPVSYHSSNSNP